MDGKLNRLSSGLICNKSDTLVKVKVANGKNSVKPKSYDMATPSRANSTLLEGVETSGAVQSA